MKKSILSLLIITVLFISGFLSGQTLKQNEKIIIKNSQNIDYIKKQSLKDIPEIGKEFFTKPIKLKNKQDVIVVFYDLKIPQIDFAAKKIKQALEKWNFSVELNSINALTRNYPKRKIVIVKKDNAYTINQCSFKIYESFENLESQGYAIRTFFMPGPQYVMNTARVIDNNFFENQLNPETYMIVGGDNNGAMYGGIDVARHIESSGVTKPLYANEEAFIKYRGIKFNLPLDEKAGTYNSGFHGTANKLAVRDAWDITFWKTWFDEMAAHKYNVLTIWNNNPFTAMLNLEDEYLGISIQGVSGFDKNENVVKINDWSIDQKIAFWKEVMKYGRDRGFDIYFFTWNIFLSTAKDKHGITSDTNNELTKTFYRKCMKKFLETYPDLTGFGVTAGESMGDLNNDQREAWMWDTYGKGMMEYAVANPTRELVFIHRLLQSDFTSMMNYFKPLSDLPNVRFDISHKYSNAHAHAAVKPTYWDGKDLEDELTKYDIKSWLTIRNDDFFFLHWADPQFVRDYVTNFPTVGKYVHGIYIGADGWVFGREFVSKNPYYQQKNALEYKNHGICKKFGVKLHTILLFLMKCSKTT